jgi:hypothetical protein
MTSCLLLLVLSFRGTNKVIHNVNMPCLPLQLAAPAKSCRPHKKQLQDLNTNAFNILSVRCSPRRTSYRIEARGLPTTVKLTTHLHLRPGFSNTWSDTCTPPLLPVFNLAKGQLCLYQSNDSIAWYDRMISEWYIGKDAGESICSLMWGIILEFARRDWRKLRKYLNKDSQCQGWVSTWNLRNTKYKYQSRDRDIRSVPMLSLKLLKVVGVYAKGVWGIHLQFVSLAYPKRKSKCGSNNSSLTINF